MPYCSFQLKSLDRTKRCITNNAPFKQMTKFLWGRLAFCNCLERTLANHWQLLSWSGIIPMMKDTAEHHLQCKINIINGICRFRESKAFSLSLKKNNKQAVKLPFLILAHLHAPNHHNNLGSMQNFKWFNSSPVIKEIKQKMLTYVSNILSLARCHSLI